MGGVGQAWRLNLPPPRDEAKGCTTVPFCTLFGGYGAEYQVQVIAQNSRAMLAPIARENWS